MIWRNSSGTDAWVAIGQLDQVEDYANWTWQIGLDFFMLWCDESFHSDKLRFIDKHI